MSLVERESESIRVFGGGFVELFSCGGSLTLEVLKVYWRLCWEFEDFELDRL